MAEEDKSNSTDKLNSDKSEMEPQTEAQRIVLKTNQDQQLKSIEMEIRKYENEMKDPKEHSHFHWTIQFTRHYSVFPHGVP